MISVIVESTSPRLSALKHLLDKLPLPPNYISDSAFILPMAAIHATVLAIVMGVFSSYGFYRVALRDQLKMKLVQEAEAINTIRFGPLTYVGLRLVDIMREAKELRKSTSLSQLVDELKDIIIDAARMTRIMTFKGEKVDGEVANRQGKRAFYRMVAIGLQHPFPEVKESFHNPELVDFKHDINTVRDWLKKLEDVTKPLMGASEHGISGLSDFMHHYALTDKFAEPFFKNLEIAHGIRQRVKEQLAVIDSHEKSEIGTWLVALGFFGASITFVISVLIPLCNLPTPIFRKVVFWEPMAFYILALIVIGELISIPLAVCIMVSITIIGYLVFRRWPRENGSQPPAHPQFPCQKNRSMVARENPSRTSPKGWLPHP
jgi:hypothetical protein